MSPDMYFFLLFLIYAASIFTKVKHLYYNFNIKMINMQVVLKKALKKSPFAFFRA